MKSICKYQSSVLSTCNQREYMQSTQSKSKEYRGDHKINLFSRELNEKLYDGAFTSDDSKENIIVTCYIIYNLASFNLVHEPADSSPSISFLCVPPWLPCPALS